MRNSSFLFIFLFLSFSSFSQTVTSKIAKAFAVFEKDAQMKNGIASLHIIDAKTGKVIFSKNAETGLAPASTQKIITSASAYEFLGRDFRYRTEFALQDNDASAPDIFIIPSGDPTLGSWRWSQHTEEAVLGRVLSSIQKKNIRSVGRLLIREKNWEAELIPDGWIWQDVGNYYGAGADVLNWRENQYDLILKSGKDIGDAVEVKGTKPLLYDMQFHSMVRSAAKGSGDQSYIYLPVGSGIVNVRGTIPVSEENFVISGSIPSPRNQFLATLVDSLRNRAIPVNVKKNAGAETYSVFHTETSPIMDSIVYWFLKKSINLYGEALVRTFAARANENATIGNGLKRLKEFWASKGILRTELNMVDGSGLSPLNRVTTHAQVHVLQYARGREWFSGFNDAFPEFNGMKMKSGTISGAKAFCGYHTSKKGEEFIFSFIVNNYNGSAASLVKKMYLVLDGMK